MWQRGTFEISLADGVTVPAELSAGFEGTVLVKEGCMFVWTTSWLGALDEIARPAQYIFPLLQVKRLKSTAV